jgi:hypothetical protein
MPSSTPRVVHRSLSIHIPCRHWRRLRRVSARTLIIALLVSVVIGPNFSTASAAPPPPSIRPALTHPSAPGQGFGITYITPEITQRGSISETLNTSNSQLQSTPDRVNSTGPIALASCNSPDYIFQNCLFGTDTALMGRLQDPAIRSVLNQYGLADSDKPLVLKYGRNEIRAALFAQVETAFQTKRSDRTPDQQTLVDTYTRLLREKHAQAARAALNEYRRWTVDPCGYRPPSGFEYDPPFQCSGAGRGPLLSSPESPGLKAFVQYGVAKVYSGAAEAGAGGYQPPSVTDPRATPTFKATSNAAQLGYGVAGAIYGGAIGGVVGSPAAVVNAVFPYAGRVFQDVATGLTVTTRSAASAGAGLAASVLAVLILAGQIAVTQGQAVAREAAIPGILQGQIDNAGGTCDESASGCPSFDPVWIMQNCGRQVLCATAANDDRRTALDQELFANVVLSTLPDYPGTDPAPAAQPGDPRLTVAGNPVDWVQYKADDGSQRSFRLSSGPWIADRAGGDGPGTLALSIKYQDADGKGWIASWIGNKFLIVSEDESPNSFQYPQPRQSTDLSVVNWSGNNFTASAGG